MRTIYKYTLDLHNAETWDIKVHEDAKILMVHTQSYTPPYGTGIRIWFETDDSRPIVTRHFFIVGTGYEVKENSNHVGSCIDGPWVWHVYENAT